MASTTTRPARPEDGPAIAEVYLAAWSMNISELTRGSPTEQSKVPSEQNLDKEELLRQANRFSDFIRSGERLFVVSESHHSTSGSLHGFVSFGPSFTRAGFGEVMQLFIHPDAQRRGIGTLLLHAAWRDMSQLSWSSSGCHVWCTKGNPGNQVYAKASWFPTGKEKSITPSLSKTPVVVVEYQAPARLHLESTERWRFFWPIVFVFLSVLVAMFLNLYKEVPGFPKLATRVRVNASNDIHAKCLDGSSPTYYIRSGYGSGRRSWLLYFQGGGWCVPADALSMAQFPSALVDTCRDRANGSRGSTLDDDPTEDWSYKELFAQNESVSPVFHNWNIVKLRYCDGSSFASKSGSANFKAILQSLLAN